MPADDSSSNEAAGSGQAELQAAPVVSPSSLFEEWDIRCDRSGTWIHWATLFTVVLLAAFCCGIKFETAVRAPGVVRPTTEQLSLRTSVAGKVSKVLVRDNQQVTAGQPLVALTTTRLEMDLAACNLRIEKIRATHDAYAAAASALDGVSVADPQVGFAKLEQVDQTLGCELVKSSFQEVALQYRSAVEKRASALRELERYLHLLERRLVSASEVEKLQDHVKRCSGEGELLVQLNRAAYRRKMAEEQRLLDDQQELARGLEQAIDSSLITAPVDGAYMAAPGIVPGGYLQAGESVGVVSPSESLVVETLVSSRVIRHLRAGQAVAVYLDAYPFGEWDLVSGEVLSVTSDQVSTSSGSGFRVRVVPNDLIVRARDGSVGRIHKGMEGTVRFLVGRQSVAQWIIARGFSHTIFDIPGDSKKKTMAAEHK